MNTDFNYKFLRNLGMPFIKCTLHPKIIGKENIPNEGPIILCGNHLHAWDQFPVICATNRTIHWMAKKEYFDGKLGPFFRTIGAIPVDRYGNTTSAIKDALRYLRNGSAIGIFPEGTRNKYQVLKNRYLNILERINSKKYKDTSKLIEKCKIIKKEMEAYEESLKEKGIIINKEDLLLPFHDGAVALAKKTGALIVPYGVTGDYTITNTNLTIRFDEPFKVEGDKNENNALLYNKVLNLVKKNYEEFGRSKK